MEGRTSRSNHQNRRFRASCDQCTDSKLKCDQVKPQCDRCASRRRACVYSLIRAVGRPPRSNTSSANNSRRTAASDADSGHCRGAGPHLPGKASQTGTIDVDNASTQESQEKRVQLQLLSPEETSGMSETSSCQSTQETHTLEFPLDNDFDFNEPFEQLHEFSLNDISLDGPMDSLMSIDGFPNLDTHPHREQLAEQDALAVNVRYLNQPDSSSLTAVHNSLSTPTKDLVITSSETQSGRLIDLAESGPAITERPTTIAKALNPLFSVDRFVDIAPSKLHHLVLQSCPEVQPSMRMPSALKETHNPDRCICPALVGSLQVFASNPVLGTGPHGLISLDLLLLLDDQLCQTQHAILKCDSCGQIQSHFQEMTLCMMADWMADNWKQWLQQRFMKSRSASYIRNCNETQQQPPPPGGSEKCCLRLGSTCIDDTTWRICMQDLIKLRLVRLTRLIKSIPYEGVPRPEGSHHKASSLKKGADTLKQETNSKIEMVLGMMDSCKS